VDLKVTPKLQLVTYKNPKAAQRVADGKPDAKGAIAIDEDKCTWCGLCELLCPECIKIYWSEEKPKPPDFIPAVGIRVDTTQCDYCGLCETICPSDAVKVTCDSAPPRTINDPIVEGSMTIDDGLCVDCTLCAEKCPYEALEVSLPLTGEIEIENLEKCDPTGCVNCFNICPTKAIYPTGDKDKIAINKEICVFCGACENACPESVLKVTRDSYHLSQIEKARDWERARARMFYDHLIGQEGPRKDIYERVIKVPLTEHESTIQAKSEQWSEDKISRQKAQERVQKLQDVIRKNWRLRLFFERGRTDPLCAAVKDEVSKPKKQLSKSTRSSATKQKAQKS
jgi:4Fe-4S ferredoxin